jgi:ABC-type branched-subunit amino acid transport system permease subunit
MWRVVNSPLGKTLQALRENPDRTRFIGINVKTYQHWAFIIGNFFLGVAGSLYCGFNQNVFADYLFWTKTFEIIIVYLLGGIYTFLGPTFGAIIYILCSKIMTSWTEYWPLTLGSIVVVITLFLPRGAASSLSLMFSILRPARGAKPPNAWMGKRTRG